MRATPRAPAVNDRGMGLPFSGRLVARQMVALDLPTFATFHRHACPIMFGKSELLRSFASLAPPSSNTRDRIEAVLRRVSPNGGLTAAGGGGGGKGGGKGGGSGGGGGGESATWLVGANHVFMRDEVLLSLQGALLQQTWAPLVRVQAAARRRVARKRTHQLRREKGEAAERAAFEAMVLEAQGRMLCEYEAEEAKEGGRKTRPVQLPSADDVLHAFELLKQLALSLSPDATAAPTSAADKAGAASGIGGVASTPQIASAPSGPSAPSAPVEATPGTHAAKLAAFRAGVGGAVPPPVTAVGRAWEEEAQAGLVAEDGTPLAALHETPRGTPLAEKQAAPSSHKKERKRTGKKVKKAT